MSCREVADRVGRWANVTKVIMGICFTILFILGMALFLSAVVALTDFEVFESFIPNVRGIIVFALCLGLFVAIVSIVGALGYFVLNKAMLIIFICGITILVILQVACGGAAFAYRNDFRNITESAWLNYTDEPTKALIQNTFHCCGGYDSTDAVNSTFCPVENTTSSYVPPPPPPPVASSSAPAPASSSAPAPASSSVEPTSSLTPASSTPASSTAPLLGSVATSSTIRGCIDVVSEELDQNIMYVGVGDIVITILEIAVIIVTIVVVVKIHNAYSYQQFKDDSALEQLRG